MTAPDRGDEGPLDERRPQPVDESFLRGGIVGIGAVTVATLGLALVGALIALVVSLVY